MTSFDRFERSLPELFDELAAPRTPDYFDDILTRTASSRQRPGWSFPERWLPVSALTARLATVPRLPLRLAAVVALLLIAALVAYLIGGSGNRKLPAPFGIAANGQIAFVDRTGAIEVGSPTGGDFRVIVAGPGHDRPVFSPDGVRFVFQQGGEIVVVDADGSNRQVLNPTVRVIVDYLAWSPDGSSLAVTNSAGELLMFDSRHPGSPSVLNDALGFRSVSVGSGVHRADAASLFRPPHGDEILFVADNTLYTAHSDGSGVQLLFDPKTSGFDIAGLDGAQWSPDGSQISFIAASANDDSLHTIFVMNADGTGPRPLSKGDSGAVVDEGHESWSPDGTRIAMMRWTRLGDGRQDFHPIAIVDVATGAVRYVGPMSVNGYGFVWSPDGTSLLEQPGGTNDLLIVDVVTGKSVKAGTVESGFSWQRVAIAP
jgi:WD40 repeat protein